MCRILASLGTNKSMLTLRIDCIPNPPPSAPNSFTWDLACAYAHERLCNLDDDTVEMQAVVTECYERACKLNDAGVVWGLGFGVCGLCVTFLQFAKKRCSGCVM